MPQRWAIRFSVTGDLRFASHHDLMRVMERVASRAQLPVGFSQGYNPRPILSLSLPRPVGVAGRDELMVLALDAPPPGAMLDDLNAAGLPGLRFDRVRALPGTKAPQARRVVCALPLTADEADRVARRIEALDGEAAWSMDRRVSRKKRRGRKHFVTRTIDLRPLVTDLEVADDTLQFTLEPDGDLWARPGEVLGLLGLPDAALARVVRTRAQYDIDAQRHSQNT